MYCTTIYYKKIIQNPDSLEMDSKTRLVPKIPDSVSWKIFLREQGKIIEVLRNPAAFFGKRRLPKMSFTS